MKDYYKNRDDTLRDRFNGVAPLYEEFRLSYPDELFRDILQYSKSPQTALEIGIGTGKATEPFLSAGIKIVAIEPNKRMSDIALKKTEGLGPIEIINAKFEDCSFDKTFDLVYAASSFQWIKAENRMELIGRCVNTGGAFAKFKTVTIVNPDDSFGSEALFNIYNDLLPEYLPKDRSAKVKVSNEYEQAGFGGYEHKDYYRKFTFDSLRYIAFMNTYTEYLVLDKEIREMFEKRITSKICDTDIIITQKCTLDMFTLFRGVNSK